MARWKCNARRKAGSGSPAGGPVARFDDVDDIAGAGRADRTRGQPAAVRSRSAGRRRGVRRVLPVRLRQHRPGVELHARRRRPRPRGDRRGDGAGVRALGEDPRLRQSGGVGVPRRSQLGVLDAGDASSVRCRSSNTSAPAEPPISDPAIADALRRLDVKLRSVVVCRLLLDWSVEETAAALRIKPGTVKSRLHRALASLERSLGHMRS